MLLTDSDANKLKIQTQQELSIHFPNCNLQFQTSAETMSYWQWIAGCSVSHADMFAFPRLMNILGFDCCSE